MSIKKNMSINSQASSQVSNDEEELLRIEKRIGMWKLASFILCCGIIIVAVAIWS